MNAARQQQAQAASAPSRPRNPQPASPMPSSSASAPPLHPSRGVASLPPRPGRRGVLASAHRVKHLQGFRQGLVSVPAPKDVQEMLAARKREEEGGGEEGGALPIREEHSVNDWDDAPTESSETTDTTSSWAARSRATAKWVDGLPQGAGMDPNKASEAQGEQECGLVEQTGEGGQEQQLEESSGNQVDDEQQRRLDEKLQRQKEKRKASREKWKARKAEQRRREQEEAQQEQQQAAAATPPTGPPAAALQEQPRLGQVDSDAQSAWDSPYDAGADSNSHHDATRDPRRKKLQHTATLLARLGPPHPPPAATTSSSMQSVEPAASAWDEPYAPPTSSAAQSRRQPNKRPISKRLNQSRNGAGQAAGGIERSQQQPLQSSAPTMASGWD